MPILLPNPNFMKQRSTLFITAFTILLFVSSCKKDKDDDGNNNPPAPKTKTELLSTGVWKFSKAKFGSIDVSGAIAGCQKDNTMTFQANGNGSIDEGLTKCNGTDPQTSTFTWSFTTSESVLHVSAVFFSGGTNDYNVVSITETELVGSQVINGQTVTVTFIH
jgi:hypothetical protein